MCLLSIKVPIWKKSGNLFNDPRISFNGGRFHLILPNGVGGMLDCLVGTYWWVSAVDNLSANIYKLTCLLQLEVGQSEMIKHISTMASYKSRLSTCFSLVTELRRCTFCVAQLKKDSNQNFNRSRLFSIVCFVTNIYCIFMSCKNLICHYSVNLSLIFWNFKCRINLSLFFFYRFNRIKDSV